MTDRKLNDIMAIDHVIRVEEDGSISELPDVYAPETVVLTDDDDGQILPEHEADLISQLESAGWSPLNGWSGQYSYAGPIMHPSEYIGGALEDYIREIPGVYAAVVVECLAPSAENDSDEPAGWMVVRQIEA